MRIELTVNERRVDLDVEPADTLLAVLRERLGLTGAKQACGSGECGSCTVLVEGIPVLACLTLAARVRGPVRTIESLAAETAGLRRRVADGGGVQCGYCTPGQVVTMAACDVTGAMGREEAAGALNGNFCRCTGSIGLVEILGHGEGSMP